MASLLDALIQQESSGRVGVLGQKTKYGQPQGLGQTLPSTGAGIAQRLGIAWRPDLMTATSQEGASYQRLMADAYLKEGQQRTGNDRDALKYYHGGPDRQQWGPKTNAYADEVMARAGNQQPMNGIMQQGPAPQNLNEAYRRIIDGAGGPMSAMPRPQDMLNDQPMGVTSQGPLSELMQIDASGLAPTPHVKPGAFDKGGKGWVIAGIIADAIAGGFGGKGGFAPAYAAQQQDERDDERYRQHAEELRAQRFEDAQTMLQRQIALKEYDRANPSQPSPTNAAKMAVETGLTPGSPEFVQFIRRYAERPIMIGGQPYGYEDEPTGGGTQTVDGVTYYNIDGKWFDNPEGR